MFKGEEFEFANDMRAALEQRAPRTAWVLILAIALILTSAVGWAHWATLEEVTNGQGRVIPSSLLQVVQTLEGGIVREILVREGDLVEKDQVLMRIDDTTFAARFGEFRQRSLALRAELARYEAEAKGAADLIVDKAIEVEAKAAFLAETNAFRARRAKLQEENAVLQQQLVQKEQELLELQARETKLAATRVPIEREFTLTQRLAKSGVLPEVDLLRLERQMAEIKGEIEVVRAAIPGARAAISEVRSRIGTASATFRAEALERLAKAQGELAVIDESERAAKDRVVRASLRAPVKGIVNKLNANSIGAVVQPGNDIFEIVPLDDTLLIEARVRPKDVAFIRPQQDASVKLTAYDYLIYGTLAGKVERISADTFTDPKSETFYRVIVRTDRNYLERGAERLPIIPGMVASVDILTGRQSVLDYLLKPVLRVRNEALRER